MGTSAGHLLADSGLPALEARALLAHLTGWRREVLVAFPEREPSDAIAEHFAQLAARRRAGEPLAYLLGTKEFFGRDFLVSPAVLVPRPETELLVELALERMSAHTAPRVLDLGTGSGAIAVSLALEQPQAQVVAVDVSPAALEVAGANARQLGAHVEFRLGSWWQPIAAGERFDLIVSNPPYIADGDHHLTALAHEPALALTDGGDGLACLREVIAGTSMHLTPQGWLGVEHGWDQGPAVRELCLNAGFQGVDTARDGADHARVTHGRAPH